MTEALPDIPIAYAADDAMQEGFLSTEADIAIFGGKAGTGKTGTALIAAGQHTDLPGFGAVVFRRLYPELFGAGSVWQQSKKFFTLLDGVPVKTPHAVWSFPSGATVEFLGLQHPGDEESHQGKRYTCVIFEECTQFTAAMFWFLFGRIDDLKDASGRLLCKGHMRGTCNPDADSFVRELVDWWIDPEGFAIEERAGVLRWFIRNEHTDSIDWFESEREAKAEAERRTASAKAEDPRAPDTRAWSFTFFPGKPSPRMGQHYHARLGTLSLVKRERMQRGNWNIRETPGNILRREWFPVVDTLPGPVMRTVRGWDKGAVAGGDATEGAKVVSLGPGKGWAIVDIVSSSSTPGARKLTVEAAARGDGPTVVQAIWQDPGGAGVYEAEASQLAMRLAGSHCTIEPATKSKVVYAESWGTAAEMGHEGKGPRFYVLRAAWNDRLFAEMDAFDGRSGGIDNKIDAVSRAWLELQKGARQEDRPPMKKVEPIKRPWSGL